MARIYRYVSCSHSAQEAFCAVLKETDIPERVSERVDSVQRMQVLAQQFVGNDDQGESLQQLIPLLLALLEQIRNLTEQVRGSRLLRWIIRRFVLVGLLLQAVERLIDTYEIAILAIQTAEDQLELLNDLQCEDNRNANTEN